MYMEKDIENALKIFREISISGLVKDKETEQMIKISEMIDSLNNGDKELIVFLDDVLREISELKEILIDKYIRIGICLERVE